MKKIKLISVGGCGVEIVNSIVEKIEKDVTTINISPNYSDHCFSKSDIKFTIGDEITSGLGCGGNIEQGEKIATENLLKIDMLLKDTEFLFLVAGLGGGTGTGITPLIANRAKRKNIFSIGIVTFPAYFEGEKRKNIAKEGIKQLKDNLDVLVIIKEDNLKKYKSMVKFFEYIDGLAGKIIVDMIKLLKKYGKIDKQNSLRISKKYNIEILFFT